MKHSLAILLLALSSNFDNLVVGFFYGARKISLPVLINLMIAFIVGAGSFLAMGAGRLICRVTCTSFGNYLGSAVLFGVGAWFIVREYRRVKVSKVCSTGPSGRKIDAPKNLWHTLNEILETPDRADLDRSGNIDLKEGALLGLALTLNNLAACLGAGISGLEPFLTTGAIAFLSLLMMMLGMRFGHFFANGWLGKQAGLIAGLLLIVISIFEFFVN